MNIQLLIDTIKQSAKDYPNGTFVHEGKNNTCINPFSYGILRHYPELIPKLDGIFVDGISMCWWIRLLWGVKIPRLSFDMTTIAKDFFNYATRNNKSVYFIGAMEDEITETINHIKEEFPTLKIIGFRNGYFKNIEDRKHALETIVKINPDFTIIGMGTPLQEQFMIDLRNTGFKGTSFTCGGYLRQASKGINYFPAWVDKYNLRGFYRQFKEKGIFKRNYNTFIEFPILFIYDSIRSKMTKSK